MIDGSVLIGLATNAGIIGCMALQHARSRHLDIAHSSVIVFFFLFMVVAPFIQLLDSPVHFVNTLSYSPSLAVRINGLVTVFLLTYWGVRSRLLLSSQRDQGAIIQPLQGQSRLAPLILLSIASIVVLGVWAWYARTLLARAGEALPLWADLILLKTVFMIPLAAFLYGMAHVRTNHKVWPLLLMLAVIILVVKNPLMERRNAIGPVYLAMLAATWPGLIRSNLRSLSLVAVVMVIAFPLASIVTNNLDVERWRQANVSDFLEPVPAHFEQAHYDAWSNVGATIEIAETEGHTTGRQIVGIALFWVPRMIWPEKPVGTGQVIGEHLVGRHSMTFENVSAPIPAEGFLEFHLLGVVGYAAALAYLLFLLQKKARNDMLLGAFNLYASFYVLFVLRGDLMSAVAFGVGAFVAIVWLVRVLENVCSGVRRPSSVADTA